MRGDSQHNQCSPAPSSDRGLVGQVARRWWRRAGAIVRQQCKRPPDFVVGAPEHPYLLRWRIFPRNRFFNIYVHKIVKDDDSRALHDHPWWNVSIILKGGYDEITPHGRKHRRRGSITFRRATDAHRLELPVRNGGISHCWSLFIVGPRIREWGFHCPQGWRPWHEFVDPVNPGEVGRGCGE